MVFILAKATLLSFLWGILSSLYMLWMESDPNRLNTAIVFGPSVVTVTVLVLYIVVVLL